MQFKEKVSTIKKHLLTGTSHMIPFIVAGGVLFSLAVMLNPEGAATPGTGWLGDLAKIGNAGLELFVSVLGGYIAYSIADRPGLAPGMIGAYLADQIGAGFLGGIVAGFIAGYVVKALKKIKLPISLKSLGSIFLYPLFGTLITGGIIVWVIGVPISLLMDSLTNWLNSLNRAGKIPLAAILGAMTAFDMGGPVNKVATLFAQTQVDTLPYLMGGVGVAICTPPIGMGIATLLAPKKYNTEEKEAGKAAIIMGTVGITEGAIPFAANDPLRVIPSIVVGAAIGNIIPFLMGVLNHAPWGGLIVLPVVEGRLGYILGIVVGSLITALMVNFLKKDNKDITDYDKETQVEDDLDIEFTEL
ncbi:PTS fructose transporter subunit EIIC [Thomasclavelia saccharogumia]|uniref:PTS fructose transporter subunit EIIC n=1 Tax=Thomasclavelia saccharogumia TaxID=341225 RepID=UPI000479F68A|nr:PTS fructose transporter subunit EIIC [Thomasclavelia saccharogumia]